MSLLPELQHGSTARLSLHFLDTFQERLLLAIFPEVAPGIKTGGDKMRQMDQQRNNAKRTFYDILCQFYSATQKGAASKSESKQTKSNK